MIAPATESAAESTLLAALGAAGLIAAGEAAQLTPLTGGVSCEVFRLDLPGRTLCVKRALGQLRVAADWQASVDRSHNEVLWLRVAAAAGLCVPTVIAEVEQQHLFVMSYFDPATHRLWKTELAAGRIDPAFAAAVGTALAQVHRATAGSAEYAAAFANDALFAALRIDPFLHYPAAAHPDLAPRLGALAARTAAARIALVHGDISPKNILAGPDGPVFLDAECACYGDPAFDLAFCLTHLLLKSVWKPQWHAEYSTSFSAMRAAYLAGVNWESRATIDARTAELVTALLLARVDGKSPADYLVTETDMAFVRAAARHFLHQPTLDLDRIADGWATRLEHR